MFLIYLLALIPGNAPAIQPLKSSQPTNRFRRSYVARSNLLTNVSLTSLLSSLKPESVDSDSGKYEIFHPFAANTFTAATGNIRAIPRSPNTRSSVTQYNKYPSTRHLKEIFIGRCYEYQYRKGITEEHEWDCDELWKMFFKAFSYKGPCNVTSRDYKSFLDAVEEPVRENRGILWSGTRELAHKYSDFMYTRKYTTLEDTLAGYLLTGLTWCGHPNHGINFEECPWACSLQSPYWSSANKRFAEKLRGMIHIVLNGTRMHLNDGRKYPSYMKHRYYLGPTVVPVLTKKHISKVIIVVAHTLRFKPLEYCDGATVRELIEDIREKRIPVECYNDPDPTRYIFCVSDPTAPECTKQNSKEYIPDRIGHLLPILSGYPAPGKRR